MVQNKTSSRKNKGKVKIGKKRLPVYDTGICFKPVCLCNCHNLAIFFSKGTISLEKRMKIQEMLYSLRKFYK